MTADLSDAAARLLAALPARKLVTVRRAAHAAGLSDQAAARAATDLVRVGFAVWAGTEPSTGQILVARLCRSELATMSANFTRFDGPPEVTR